MKIIRTVGLILGHRFLLHIKILIIFGFNINYFVLILLIYCKY